MLDTKAEPEKTSLSSIDHLTEALEIEQGATITGVAREGSFAFGLPVCSLKAYSEHKLHGVSVKRYPKAYAYGSGITDFSDSYNEFEGDSFNRDLCRFLTYKEKKMLIKGVS